jgi:hypothetical protein
MHTTLYRTLLAALAIAVVAILVAVDPTAGTSPSHPWTLTVAATAIAPVERLDVLVGARAIAAFCNMTRDQVYHQFRIGALPLKKQGELLVGSKSVLARHLGATVEKVTEDEEAGQAGHGPAGPA